jgi:regulator of RNase E activity RraA
MIIWGFHRDTAELIQIGFPLFSYGSCLAGPLRLDPRDPDALTNARFGNAIVTNQDVVFADADGILFIPDTKKKQILSVAEAIFQRERRQAEEIRGGTKLREQLHFSEYLDKRSSDPTYTLRQHLRTIGGAIEE